MTGVLGINPAAWEEATHFRNRLRLTCMLLKIHLRKVRWKMSYAMAAIGFYLLQTDFFTPTTFGMVFDKGVAFGFAILFWFAMNSKDKEHRVEMATQSKAHKDDLKALLDDAKAREERLLKVIELSAAVSEKLVAAVDRLDRRAEQLAGRKFCAFEDSQTTR